MWKYIIAYCLFTWEIIPCPDYIPGSLVSCAALHQKLADIRCNQYLYYFDRDSAFKEFKRMKYLRGFEWDSVKIDSILIK